MSSQVKFDQAVDHSHFSSGLESDKGTDPIVEKVQTIYALNAAQRQDLTESPVTTPVSSPSASPKSSPKRKHAQDTHSPKSAKCSPQRSALASRLLKTGLSEGMDQRFKAFDKYKMRRASLPGRNLFAELGKEVETDEMARTDQASKIDAYQTHVSSMMKAVKMDYFRALNAIIEKKKLTRSVGLEDSARISIPEFSLFYQDLEELVSEIHQRQLNEYVLRYASSQSSDEDPAVIISAQTGKIVGHLKTFGFTVPDDKKLVFWSGSVAKEKAMASDGVTDEEILLLDALWAFDSLIAEKEKASSKTRCRTLDIHTKLIVAFSSILAEFAKGREVDYYLGYDTAVGQMLNVSSAFCKGELPTLREKAAKINFNYIENDQWIGPLDLKTPEGRKALLNLRIGRIDYGKEKGPRSTGQAISAKKLTSIIGKWKTKALSKKGLQRSQSKLLENS